MAEANIPVIVDPFMNAPASFDQVGGRADNAKLLVEQGVDVVIASFQTHNARVLRQVAGNAVRAGLSSKAALDAVSSTPAAVFGMTDYGQLAPGFVANIVVWSGDPFELRTSADVVMIEGKITPKTSRQIQLMERYRQLPGTPNTALEYPKRP